MPQRCRGPIRLGVSIVVALLACAPATAGAQYFGQNKVQYDRFDFQVLATPHFDIYYYSSEADAAKQVARMAERWYERLSSILGWELSSRQPVVLYASHPEFEQTNVVEGLINEGTGGVTEGLQRRVVLPLAASLGETDHVLGHELVHAFQYDILGPRVDAASLWFIEGMAEYLSLGPRHEQTAMWLRDAALEDDLPSIDDLANPRYFPYRFGHAFWAYVGGRWGDRRIGDILSAVAGSGPSGAGGLSPKEAIAVATEMDPDELSAQWHQSIRTLYGIAPPPEDEKERDDDEVPEGVTIFGERTGSGSLNVGPSLSPDGTRVAFLSSRNRLAIDLYVADTTSGKILHRLTETSVDPHFQSLEFLQSAGSWSPDGRRLAVATVRSGRPQLAIFDAVDGKLADEIEVDRRGEIFQPAWSPDGSRIVFTAQIGGVTDLLSYSFDTGEITHLTNDAFADLQPAWSPDGRRIAFVTDRFSSQLADLEFGAYQLAELDVSSGEIRPLRPAMPGNSFNPQWSADGSSIFFVGTATGRPEIYEARLAGDDPRRLTEVVTGVSGITPLSPAFSISRQTGRVAYTVFRDSGYEIHFMDADGESPLTDRASRLTEATTTDLAVLPPAERETSVVARELSRPRAGLPSGTDFSARAYRPNLSLVGVGQQIGGATSGTFGTYVTGGVSFLFSDLLGDHLLSTGAAINGTVKDFGAQVAYIDRTHRWNWGAFAEQLPVLTGSVSTGFATINGQNVFVEATDLRRQRYTTIGGLVAYPFSRVLRLELGASAQRIGFDREVHTEIFDPVTGQFLGRDVSDVSDEPAISLIQTTAALVRDSSAFGATGPILGQRFRIEASPTAGDLDFFNVTADLRQYVMPVRPLTLAGRAVHVGRYGGNGEDRRLLPLFLGYPTLVRGYDAGSFEASECTIDANGNCPEFDRLIGSRMVVFNGEARIPLFGFGGDLNYGPIPTELFAFFDTGVAWTQSTTPSIADGDRDWVRSTGFGARVNLLGYAIGEFNAVRPLDRSGRGWMFVFNLRPGY